MVDMATLLRRPAGEAKKPPCLPGGDYPIVIKSYEMITSRKKGTPGIRFMLGITGWPDDIEESEREGIELHKKQLRYDHWTTDENLFLLDALLRDALGMDVKGREYEELIPETIGQTAIAKVVQAMTDKGEVVNNVEGLRAEE